MAFDFSKPRRLKVTHRFFLGDHDRLTIDGVHHQLFSQRVDGYILRRLDTESCEFFSFSRLQHLSQVASFKHELEYFLPAEMRKRPSSTGSTVDWDNLPRRQAERARTRLAWVFALNELQNHEDPAIRVGKTEEQIKANIKAIHELAEEYMVTELESPEVIEKKRQIRAGERRKPRSLQHLTRLKEVSASALRKWQGAFKSGGVKAVVDDCQGCGNWRARLHPDANALLIKSLRSAVFRFGGCSKKTAFQLVGAAFHAENKKRAAEDLLPLHTPSYKTVVKRIKEFDQLAVKIAQLGREEALRQLRPVGSGLEVSRLLERVEIDEWKTDLMTHFVSIGGAILFTEDELQLMGLNGQVDRWHACMALDCRSRALLGLKLTWNPNTSTALECLRMVTMDKGEFANAVGAASSWHQFGIPEEIVTDNGVFRSTIFSDACTTLGATLIRPKAGTPSARARGERLFRTAIDSLCDMLSGKTFTEASRPNGYDPKSQACLDLEEFATTLVCWIVDIYNNTPHSGLFGLSPAQQWEYDMEQGNYPLHALPDKRTRRLAFGKRLERKLQKDGLHVLGLRYQCPKLAQHWIRNPSATMSLRWDCADIGAIEVSVDGEWVEAEAAFESAPDGSPVDGMHYQEWIAVIRALRATARNRKSFDEAAVFDAINSIRATDEAKRIAFKLTSLHPDDDQIKKFENTLLDGFRISAHRKSLKPAASGYGETITPMNPSDANPAPVDTGSGAALPRKKAKKINIGE